MLPGRLGRDMSKLRTGRVARWLLGPLGSTEQLLTALAVAIGLTTALGALGFTWLIEFSKDFFFGDVGTRLFERGLFLLLLPLLPMIGAVFVGLITHFFAPEAEGHGVPEVMDAMARRGGRIRPRVAGAKAVASALTIGSGGSAGTEGPIIQIGAAIGSGFGQWLRMSPNDLRVLIGCGAAAGISAIFNAPIAGMLFAVEVLLRDVSLRSFLPIIISSVASFTLTHALRGTQGPLFPVPFEVAAGAGPVSASSIYSFTLSEVGNYLVLGVVCGLVALAFVKLLYLSEDLFRKLPVQRAVRPVVGALLLGLLAVGTHAVARIPQPSRERAAANPEAITAAAATHVHQPAVMGNGYPVIARSLNPEAYGEVPTTGMHWTIRVLVLLLVGKILATCFTLGSGGSGGVFAPSLFIGATTGGAFGLAVQATGWFPNVTPGAYALVGMAAVVASSIHAPLTAGLMLFELTGDYEVIIPIMLAGVTALAIYHRFEPASIYTLKLLRRGVDIFKGQDISVLRNMRVREAMRPASGNVRPGDGLMEVVARLVEHSGDSLFVVDEDQRLRGVITGTDSRMIMADPATFAPFIIARDIMRETGFPAVSPDDSLAEVMRSLARYRGEVPVVEDGRLVGVIWPEDVLERYNAEIFKRDMASSMVTSLAVQTGAEPIPSLENTSIMEMPVPPLFVGKSVRSLDIRRRYEVTILLIRQQVGPNVTNAVPSADYVFSVGDMMLVMGPDERLRRLARGEVLFQN